MHALGGLHGVQRLDGERNAGFPRFGKDRCNPLLHSFPGRNEILRAWQQAADHQHQAGGA